MSRRVRVLTSIQEVTAEAWDGLLAGGDARLPFVRHAWIDALEGSGSACRKTGWEPQHVTLWEGKMLVGCGTRIPQAPQHGEYVYDFSWAEAARSMGISYYPEALAGCTPQPDDRAAPLEPAGPARETLERELLDAARGLARETECSGVHLLYPPSR